MACDKQHYGDALGHYVLQTRIKKGNQYTHADNENYLQYDYSTSEGAVNWLIDISIEDQTWLEFKDHLSYFNKKWPK